MTNKEATPGSVLFLCIENSSRSVMAEGFAKRSGLGASSAGTFPSSHVNSLVIDAMGEVGTDGSESKPKELTSAMVDGADLVVLTDAGLEKAIPGGLWKKMRKKTVGWYLRDPQGKGIDEIRGIRDQIERLVQKLTTERRA